MITELEFRSLAAQGFNRIPLIAEAFADLETPLSLYLKLVGGARHGFLLESVVGGERFGRYSFIGLPARVKIVAEMGEARGEVRAAVHQHDEGAGNRTAADGTHGVVKATLVFGKRIACHGGESVQIGPLCVFNGVCGCLPIIASGKDSPRGRLVR